MMPGWYRLDHYDETFLLLSNLSTSTTRQELGVSRDRLSPRSSAVTSAPIRGLSSQTCPGMPSSFTLRFAAGTAPWKIDTKSCKWVSLQIEHQSDRVGRYHMLATVKVWTLRQRLIIIENMILRNTRRIEYQLGSVVTQGIKLTTRSATTSGDIGKNQWSRPPADWGKGGGACISGNRRHCDIKSSHCMNALRYDSISPLGEIFTPVFYLVRSLT